VSVSNNSDLILGVMKAANPVKLAIATGKLKNAERTTVAGNNFQVMVNKRFGNAAPARDIPADLISGVLLAAEKTRQYAAVRSLGGEKFKTAELDLGMQKTAAHAMKSEIDSQNPMRANNQKFEALMLRNFVENVLPKSDSGIFGQGTSGDIWRSMEADFISQDMAKAGGIGIADQLDLKQTGKVARQVLEEYSFSGHKNIAPAVEMVADRTWPYFKMTSA
jgi:peptidoglycan hydrolase FlgJ